MGILVDRAIRDERRAIRGQRMCGGSLVAGEWDETSKSKSWYECASRPWLLLEMIEWGLDKPERREPVAQADVSRCDALG